MKMVRTIMIIFNDMKIFSEAFINANFHNGFTFLVFDLCPYSKTLLKEVTNTNIYLMVVSIVWGINITRNFSWEEMIKLTV